MRKPPSGSGRTGSAGEARQPRRRFRRLGGGQHHAFQRHGAVGVRHPAVLPDQLRRQVADELQAALRRVRQRQPGEAGDRAARLHRPFEIGDAGDGHAAAAQPFEVRLLVLHRQRDDVQPGVAREPRAQPVVEARRVEDGDQLDVAVLEEGAAIAGAVGLHRQVRRAAAALLRHGGEGEAEALKGGGERREVARGDAHMVERDGGAHRARAPRRRGRARPRARPAPPRTSGPPADGRAPHPHRRGCFAASSGFQVRKRPATGANMASARVKSRAEEEGSASLRVQRLGPGGFDPGDVGQRLRRAPGAGELASRVEEHGRAQAAEAGMHLAGQAARVGARRAVRRPEVRRVFGAILADGEALPDAGAVVLQDRGRCRTGWRLHGGRVAAAVERDHHLLDLEPGEAHGQPTAQAPGRVALVADHQPARRGGRLRHRTGTPCRAPPAWHEAHSGPTLGRVERERPWATVTTPPAPPPPIRPTTRPASCGCGCGKAS